MARALVGGVHESGHDYLARLGLTEPKDFRERLTAKLVCLGLRATARERSVTSRTTAQDP
jgi:hypothetical protein